MKIGKAISDAEMRQMKPQLMDAWDKMKGWRPDQPLPDGIIYCFKCDGIRIKDHGCTCFDCQAPIADCKC